MISYIKGTIEAKSSNYVVIENQSIGYKIYMTDTALQSLEEGKQAKIHTYMKVSEDDISLYGFLTSEEKAMFELLISVGGIGAKSAIKILSSIEPSCFALAVITDDLATLKKLPGVGIKSAQRIILELKDKIKTENTVDNKVVETRIKNNENLQDAIDALQVLGYNKKSIEIAFEKEKVDSLSTEDLIRLGLKNLSR
jgi:Holliday junction DNA helicase RuvA